MNFPIDFVTYTSEELDKWTHGSLLPQWKRNGKYQEFLEQIENAMPNTFKRVNLNLNLEDDKEPFHEIRVGIHFIDKGYRVFYLNQTYLGVTIKVNAKNKEVQGIIGEIIGFDNLKLLKDFTIKQKSKGIPDLFVFRAKSKEVYFIEVKSPTDRLRPEQKEFLNYVMKHNICKVKVVNTCEKPIQKIPESVYQKNGRIRDLLDKTK